MLRGCRLAQLITAALLSWDALNCVSAQNESPEESMDEVDRFLVKHQFGPACKQAAEEVEGEHGFFDDLKMSAETRRILAQEIVERMYQLTGHALPMLEEELYMRLDSLKDGERPGSMGAGDVCEFALRHYDSRPHDSTRTEL
eukprot:TRINITY_DN50462_c0_g1_i1.p1 TRINITY_DN50462_c0_g1~~TRINITY_DN50462_c0_g1_i1.p1  ORF type:complete len:143 (-),score=34.68 TRINITY_DN50462_c0_g1_i1:242-670(-)